MRDTIHMTVHQHGALTELMNDSMDRGYLAYIEQFDNDNDTIEVTFSKGHKYYIWTNGTLIVLRAPTPDSTCTNAVVQEMRDAINAAYDDRIDDIVRNRQKNNMTQEAMIDWLRQTHEDYNALMSAAVDIEGFITAGNPFKQ